jgi:hypothetical protein
LLKVLGFTGSNPVLGTKLKRMEVPHNWVILKSPNNQYKVFATWNGGYLDGDRWKLNSGIVKTEQDSEYYYFTGYSGNCYKCHKKGYGIRTSYGLSILNEILEKGKGLVELMENSENFENIL